MIDRLTTRTQRCCDSAPDNCASSLLHLSLSRCHVCTNKSAYLRADTKVTELDLSPGVHQHIGWLDICGDKLLDRTATQALRRHYLSTPTCRFTHLDEVFSGSTDMSGL